VKKTVLVSGKKSMVGEKDVLVVDVVSFDSRVGIDIRSYYPANEKQLASAAENGTSPTLIKISGEQKPFLPGKGIFLPVTHVSWLIATLKGIAENETFAKLLAEAKEAPKADAKKSERESKLEAELAEMRAMLAKLTGSKTETAKADASAELEEVVPASAVTSPTRRSRSTK
jgi:hypothetical protein